MTIMIVIGEMMMMMIIIVIIIIIIIIITILEFDIIINKFLVEIAKVLQSIRI